MPKILHGITMLPAMAIASVLTGCASIVSGTNQIISVEARHKGEPVIGATCKLQNEKGAFFVTTPGTVTVHRSYGDLLVKCEKENLSPGITTVKSRTKPMAFGNILIGGAIGAAIDTGSGAAYDYPTLIRVAMGETHPPELPSRSLSPSPSTPASTNSVASVKENQPTQEAPVTSMAPSTSGRPVERQLTGAKLFDHFAEGLYASGRTSQNEPVDIKFNTDGVVEFEIKNSGSYGSGVWQVKQEEDQICFSMSSKKFKSARGCYKLFQEDDKTFELRSVSDNYTLHYSLSN